MKERINKFLNSSMNRGLSWTTIASEKLLLAIIGISTCVASAIYLYEMILAREILLGDLFMLFIYAEILAMVGAFYSTNRIPVTCLLYTSPSPRDRTRSRMPSSA